MSLDSLLRNVAISVAAGIAVLAGGSSQSVYAADPESEVKNPEPDFYEMLFSHSLNDRDLATEGILKRVRLDAKSAPDEISALEKTAKARGLNIPPSFFSEQKSRARNVKANDYKWATYNPELWKEETLAAVGNTLARVLQTLELDYLAKQGITPPPGMVLIPAGSFIKGSVYAEAQYFEALTDSTIPPEWKLPPPNNPKGVSYHDRRGYIAESPRRDIQIKKSFWIDILEVTNGDYAKYCKETQTNQGYTIECKDIQERGISNYLWENLITPAKGQENYPFPFASLVSAKAFAEHYGKRIPTEDEWEKAARGIDGRLLPWGNSTDYKRGRFVEARDTKEEILAPVGGYPSGASPYGALDMAGNVSEWTSSVLHIPTTSDWKDAEKTSDSPAEILGMGIVKGGGGWAFGKSLSEERCARGAPTSVYSNFKYGFRCAKDIASEHQYLQ